MTLLIMAAGMGSRYGGIKQIEPIGENGELIIDYSVYDAIRAGFDRAVFVIRRDIEKDFCDRFFNRIKRVIRAEYVFQEIPAGRTKPFGTTDAVLAAKDILDEPFCVINADDYYGRAAFETIAQFLKTGAKGKTCALVAWDLKNTLSDFGSVNRGVLTLDDKGLIIQSRESKCERVGGILGYHLSNGFHPLPEDTKVNMNFFGLTPDVLPLLDNMLAECKIRHQHNPAGECLLPDCLGQLANEGKITLRALTTPDKWVGVTYPQDRAIIVSAIRDLVSRGLYPKK